MARRRRPSPHRVAQLAGRASRMRWSPTPSEARLWSEALGGRKLGVQFCRQVVIAGYIVDFAAPAARLVVEVDGGWHAGREGADARRDRALQRAGWRVLRLEAAVVLGELAVAVERVRAALAAGGGPSV